jgi:polyhydroxyalkanoate synthesis regulator phasin
LEEKAHHFESQLKAYESSSENEVVDRLHQEVADIEQRVKTRNLEIQILERRVSGLYMDTW